MDNRFQKSRELQPLAHRLIPGGCHTYAKGDDQFPLLAPGFIARGQGSHVWDLDGNEYIEYGMGCRAVTLGHAFEPVIDAVREELANGVNFCRPSPLEVEYADRLLSLLPAGEMCKFAKNGSDTTTAAFKLARAVTGRTKIALCQDHPFFSVDDWFIGTTAIHGGIPQSTRDESLMFRYNDPDSLRYLFEHHRDQIAAVILEPAKYSDPEDDFLHRVQELCHEFGALFILDEMITGFRWKQLSAQVYYDIDPDLSTFGKALANGFSLSALVGKREYMERGGLYHDQQRVFLLSTTHGAETHALAAGMATIDCYEKMPVVDTLHQQGEKLRQTLEQIISEAGLSDHIPIIGMPCNLVFGSRDENGEPSQKFRCLLMQELIRHGVIGPSLVVSYSHSDDDIEKTGYAFSRACEVYKQALSNGIEGYLVGRPSQTVYENYNKDQFKTPPDYFAEPGLSIS